VHTTCSPKIKAELELTRKRIAAGKEEGKKMVSAGLIATHQKKLTARELLEGDREDGEKPETLTTAFRREFRSSLLVVSCKGLADMLAAAGHSRASTRFGPHHPQMRRLLMLIPALRRSVPPTP
jgi:hypothetical protein